MTTYCDFGIWLLGEIDHRGWRQADLARRAGVTTGGLNGVITGDRKPGRDMLVALARALSLPVDEMYRAAGILPESNTPAGYAELQQLYLHTNDKTRQEILEYARWQVEKTRKSST